MKIRAWQKSVRRMVQRRAAGQHAQFPEVYRRLTGEEIRLLTREVTNELSGVARRPIRFSMIGPAPDRVWCRSWQGWVVLA